MAFRRGWIGLVLVLAVGCATPRALCPREGGDTWTEVQSRHFRVRTNLRPAAAAETARELELLRRALLFAWGPDFAPEDFVDVVILRDLKELSEFTQGHFSGHKRATDRGSLLILSGHDDVPGRKPSLQLQAHELTHHLSDYVLLHRPKWLSEGLAGYLETVELTPDGSQAILGRPSPWNLERVREDGWLDLDALWDWDGKSVTDPDAQARYYASAWLWVHYLINKHPSRFDAFQALLARAESPRRAWKSVFGDGADLKEGLGAYVASGLYAVLTQPLPPIPTELASRELDSAEIHAIRGLLYFKAGGVMSYVERLEKARAEVEQGLREDPTNVSAAVLAAQVYADNDEHLERARALVKAHPDSGSAWDLLAVYLDASAEPELVAQARQSAARLLPLNARVQQNLARHHLSKGRLEEGLTVARRAVALAPDNLLGHVLQAEALFRLERCPEAVAHQRRAVALLTGIHPEPFRKQTRSILKSYEAKCGEAVKTTPP
ncbi:hypothetical protein MYSTI_05829 [Myxococcus stipitatus DSM 14675]|uniref:Uncharacterized protein n=1 Tax=Myxococcus stipitatus (strain DSM 14675 / JCM 12634 / Mx s8) TaxID=1278073 RepID=L7UGV3_MYXSD|nr:hypothetical protein [Myxococcus stipitatus]AGC47105.1 hypothetical protein MYSTI_05829 [Myxococcus stipitatus DSM 14675]